jgi:hypothetical protein
MDYFNYFKWVREALVLVGFVLASTTPVFGQSHTNIILIVSDDQGYNELGAQGNEVIHTPNLDRLAQEGVMATNFYVTIRGVLLPGRVF